MFSVSVTIFIEALEDKKPSCGIPRIYNVILPKE